STQSATSGMGCGVELAIYRNRLDRARAGFISPDAGKLSDHPASLARRDLFFTRLDHGDEIVSIVRGALQQIRRDLSGLGVDHHFTDVDVSDLFVPAARRQIERNSSAGTRKAPQIRNVRAGDATGVMSFDFVAG